MLQQLSIGIRAVMFKTMVKVINSSDSVALYKISVNKNKIKFLIDELDKDESFSLAENCDSDDNDDNEGDEDHNQEGEKN